MGQKGDYVMLEVKNLTFQVQENLSLIHISVDKSMEMPLWSPVAVNTL